KTFDQLLRPEPASRLGCRMHPVFHEILGNEAECCSFLCESNEKIDIRRIELLAEAQPPQVCRAQQTGGHRKGKLPGSYITVFDHSSWQRISTVTSGMRFRALFESLTARI